METLHINNKREIELPINLFKHATLYIVKLQDRMILLDYDKGNKFIEFFGTLNKKDNYYKEYLYIITHMEQLEIRNKKIRLPKKIIEKYNLEDEITLDLNKKYPHLIINNKKRYYNK